MSVRVQSPATTMHAPNQLPPEAILPVFLGAFALSAYFIAAVSGWRHIAKKHPATGPTPGALKYFVWGQVGWVNYQHCLRVGGDERGLYLVPFFIFRLFHPPLFIPWSEIQTRKQERHFFVRVDTIELGREFSRIRLQSSALKPFQAHLPPVA